MDLKFSFNIHQLSKSRGDTILTVVIHTTESLQCRQPLKREIRCLELFPDTYAVPARDQWSPFYRSRKLLKFYVPYNWLLYLVVCTHRRVAGNSPPACFAGRVEIRHVIFIKRPCGHFLLFDFRVSFVYSYMQNPRYLLESPPMRRCLYK